MSAPRLSQVEARFVLMRLAELLPLCGDALRAEGVVDLHTAALLEEHAGELLAALRQARAAGAPAGAGQPDFFEGRRAA